MRLRKPLSILLSLSMIAGMSAFASNAAVTSDESVSAGNYYNANYLESYASKAYNESGLGSVYSKTSTTWKTWSPDASSVKLKLYTTGSDNEAGASAIGTYDMKKDSSTGVWSLNLSGDYKNKYYTYLVTVNGTTKETQDVYSQAVGVNGNRTMVVDLDSTDPSGWSDDKHVLFNSASEAAVWEVHVRDFSVSKNSGVSEDNKGKYLAFAEGGTTLNSDTSSSAVSTGIDYLVEQGINCVQLMPVYDFGSVKEDAASSSSNRNWGYDPVNYNAPEGSYSTNPYNGNTRITEFKQMIQALHDRGISVVMDVVYNHTYSTDSCFNRTVPGYYYRMNSSSSYSNGSGCGSETASDKLMYRKYMIESVKYWAEEYHIDGFRFDLMGIHDITTMNDIRSALDGLYLDGSGKKILMYGEPWTGGSVAISDGCSQSKAGSLNSRVGMFCDSYRDAIKGSTDGSDKGFVQGNTDKSRTVANGVTGKGFSAQAPSQTIAYADAHDNLILWDKIVKSNGSSSWNSTSSSLKGQVKKVMGLLLTSQGIPFMTAGSEFCRTKQGDANSYKSSDAINEIDWSRVKTYSDVAAYYKGLLEIRENYSPMKSSTFNTPSFQSTYGDVVAYTYSNNKSNEWGKVCVLVNASSTNDWPITLDGSGWTVVADGTTAGLKSLGTVSGNTYTVPANSACVLVQSSTFDNLKVSEKTFGTVTIKHIDDSGKVLKTSTAKYADGTTYRTYPDTTILYDYTLKDTQGVTSGTVTGGKNYNVTYVYSSSGIRSGYVTVNYVDENGESIKDTVSTKYREGDSYSVPFTSIQGYQLDTDKYPANTTGTFNGTNTTVNFVYKALDNTSSVVHYYNSNNWSNVRCYAYTDGGEEPNGKWNNATVMTSEGNGWLKCTIPASSSYVMFHTGSQQEPGANETGYLVSGEAWIQNKKLSFSSKVITSHIDAATGEKIADDEILIQSKVSSSDTYKTSPLAGRSDYIASTNASGNLSSGIINVVYLYTSSVDPTVPPTTVTPTTAPVTEPTTAAPTTEPVTTEPVTQPTEKILIGDANLDGKIDVVDATLLQKYIVRMTELSDNALLAAALCDGEDDIVSVKDATCIQMYIALMADHGNVGKYYEVVPPTTVPVTEPTTEPATEEPTETPTTAPVTEPTTEAPTTEPATEPVTEAPTTEPATEPVSTYTLKFTDSLSWGGTLYCYSWVDGDAPTKAWPGVAMTYVNTNDYGQRVYKVTVPSNVDYVIFTNGSGQTIDIPFDGSALNFYAKSSYDSLGHAEVGTW